MSEVGSQVGFGITTGSPEQSQHLLAQAISSSSSQRLQLDAQGSDADKSERQSGLLFLHTVVIPPQSLLGRFVSPASSVS